jgi:hypothetical protein
MSLLLARITLAALLTLLAACSEPPEDPNRPGLWKAGLQLNWVPEPEFGGYYAARDAAAFRAEGLEIDIRPGGPGVPGLQLVAANQVEFGITSADSLLVARARGADLVAIFALYQPRIEESATAYFEALDALNQVLVPTNDSQVIVAARNTVVTHERATYDLLFQRNIAIREVLDPTQRAVINTALRDLLDLDSLAELPEQLQFPDNLMGQSAETAVASLTRDGWQVVAETPGLVQLDRRQESLDLDVNRNGIITGFNLR